MIKKNSNVDVAFMLDATSSMEKNLKAVEDNIAEIVFKIRDAFDNILIRVALVAYRDFSEGGFHFKILDLTSDIEEFTRVLGGVRAYRGGDIPEDVLGALDKTVNLNWEAANKLLFQIGRYCIHNTIFYEFLQR